MNFWLKFGDFSGILAMHAYYFYVQKNESKVVTFYVIRFCPFVWEGVNCALLLQI